MFPIHNLRNWVILVVGIGAIIFQAIEISQVGAFNMPTLIGSKPRAKQCLNVTCLKPKNPSSCYIIPEGDEFFVRRQKGSKADCCKSYRCFKRDGSGYTFNGLKGYGTEIVHHNTQSHHKSVPKEIQELSKPKDTKASVSSVATGEHDSNANVGDEKMMKDMMKEFEVFETPSEKSEESTVAP